MTKQTTWNRVAKWLLGVVLRVAFIVGVVAIVVIMLVEGMFRFALAPFLWLATGDNSVWHIRTIDFACDRFQPFFVERGVIKP